GRHGRASPAAASRQRRRHQRPPAASMPNIVLASTPPASAEPVCAPLRLEGHIADGGLRKGLPVRPAGPPTAIVLRILKKRYRPLNEIARREPSGEFRRRTGRSPPPAPPPSAAPLHGPGARRAAAPGFPA